MNIAVAKVFQIEAKLRNNFLYSQGSVLFYDNPNVIKISKSKLNYAILQGYWTTANSTVQKYKGHGCCQLNCAKVQRSWMLQSQLCKVANASSSISIGMDMDAMQCDGLRGV